MNLDDVTALSIAAMGIGLIIGSLSLLGAHRRGDTAGLLLGLAAAAACIMIGGVGLAGAAGIISVSDGIWGIFGIDITPDE